MVVFGLPAPSIETFRLDAVSRLETTFDSGHKFSPNGQFLPEVFSPGQVQKSLASKKYLQHQSKHTKIFQKTCHRQAQSLCMARLYVFE